MKPLLAAALCLPLFACNYETDGETAGCTVSLQGALTGSYDCKPAFTAWNPTVGVSPFTFSIPQSGAQPAIIVAISWPSAPKVGHYLNSDPGADSDVSV